jgi:hypothetical protein
MKTSRFTDSQIIAILKQAETGSPVPGARHQQCHVPNHSPQEAAI